MFRVVQRNSIRCKSRQDKCIHCIAEKAHSRKPTVAISRSRHPYRGVGEAYIGRIRSATGVYGSVCCEDLLRGATACCSPVAGELVLCSISCAYYANLYTGQSWISEKPVNRKLV